MAGAAEARRLARATLAALTLVAIAGCARTARLPAPTGERHAAVAPAEPAMTEPPWGARIARVAIHGANPTLEALIRRELSSHVGAPLDQARVADDVRRIHELETFSEVRVETFHVDDGIELSIHVTERLPVLSVRIGGHPDGPAPLLPLAGDAYDPAQVWRAARGIERSLRDRGYLDARVREGSDVTPRGATLRFEVSAGPRFSISRIEFPGAKALSHTELLAALDTHDDHVNAPGKIPRPDLMAPDRLRLSALYYDRGHVNVRVSAPELERDAANSTVVLRLRIDEGPAFHLGRVEFSGALAAPRSIYTQRFGLRSGALFSRLAVQEGLERVHALHRSVKRDALDVRPETEIDTERALVHLKVVVGP